MEPWVCFNSDVADLFYKYLPKETQEKEAESLLWLWLQVEG